MAEGMGDTELLLLAAVGGYLAYSWYTSTGLFAPSAAATTSTTPATTAATTTATAAPVTSNGSYTTALTSQPPPATVAAPVSTAVPPATTTTTSPPPAPISPPAGAAGCSDADYDTMAGALEAMATGDSAMDSQGRMDVFNWDWFVQNKMNGQGIAPAVLAATGNQNANLAVYTACDYVALRAQYGAATGLSGLGRMNVPLVWRQAPAGQWR